MLLDVARGGWMPDPLGPGAGGGCLYNFVTAGGSGILMWRGGVFLGF